VAKLDLVQVKAACALHGGTVNDVVLAACAGGLRELLLSRGKQPHPRDARTMVPVSVRSENLNGELDNQVSAVFVDLPVDALDPVTALHDVRRQMTKLKAQEGASAGEAFFGLVGYLPPIMFALGERAVWKIWDTQHLMNTITTNVPGPQFPLYCLGRRMLELYPYVMLPKNIRVAMAIFSYDGGVYFGVSGDYDHAPDIQAVCDGIESTLARLLGAPALAEA
jgi:WS/DGAT/MGAT family acyltransferase